MKRVSGVLKGISIASITCALLIGTGFIAQDSSISSQGDESYLTNQLLQLTKGKLRISHHSMTGRVSFMGTELSNAIPQPSILGDKPTPEETARGFLSSYGSLFGLKNQARELVVMRSKMADRGRSFVRFQQVYSGIPIVGGELIVQLNSSNNILSTSGEILPDIEVDTFPRVSAGEAQRKALDVVFMEYGEKYPVDRGSLEVTHPELWVYNPMLLGLNVNITRLVWRMEVFSSDILPIRELVLIDAKLGTVALHFNQIDAALNRLIYDLDNTWGPLPGTLIRDETGYAGGTPPDPPIDDVDDAYDYAGDTYDFYMTEHVRDSIDNLGMSLISTTRYCPDAGNCPYANAFWNGSQMVYGEGFASADDVVAHEMTHGVTEYESHLFYYMQSGAINEAFSDIWGEFVDLTNGAGNDDPGVRWLMGEDLSIGAIRSLENPTLYYLPDRMGSPFYVCGDWWYDYGGVHYNMGVGSKAAYLMTDGDTFNGYTVTGLGISQVADLFYEVQTYLLTSASDYQDLYDALIQAANNLGFSPSDEQQVQNAVDATEMNQQPPGCPATEAPTCESGVYTTLFFDNLENPGSGNWASGAIVGVDEWYYPQTANPYGFDATYATSGQYNFWGYDQGGASDTYMAMTLDIALPAGSTIYMHFNHSYEFETWLIYLYDGGVVEYSTDGGSTWNDAGSLFITNGYTGSIYTGFGNPLGGRQAFVSYSSGYISSRLDLSSLAGQNVRFRFRIGTDTSGDMIGWFIDDVHIYICMTAPDAPTNLVASAIPPNQVNLSWIDNSNDEDGFKIERKTSSGGSFNEIDTVAPDITSYADTTVTLGESYYYCYRVRAYNTYGDSGYSNQDAAYRAASQSAPFILEDFGVTDGNACFIATAAYGSSVDPHVEILREFRDRFLVGNPMGKAFVDFYYKYSSPIADFIAIHNSLRVLMRWSLLPLIGLSWVGLKLGPMVTVMIMVFLTIMITTIIIGRVGKTRRGAWYATIP